MKVKERYMMKRVLAILMTIILVMGNSVGVLAAEFVDGQSVLAAEDAEKNGTCGESATWTLENGVLTISGSGEMYDYDALESIPWYAYKDEIISVVISERITQIGNNAFQECSSLESIVIPESVRVIPVDAFEDISDFTIYAKTGSYAEKFAGENKFWFVSTGIKICKVNFDVNGGASISEATRDVEYGKKIESFPIAEKEGLLFLGWYTEKENGEVVTKDTIIEDDITLYAHWGTYEDLWVIDENGVLSKYKGFQKDVKIPNTVVEIGKEVFYDNDILETIEIPEGVTTIGESAFYSCDNLECIELPETIIKIEKDSFVLCKSLTDINIPNGVKKITEYAFGGCSSLTSIVLPESVESIETMAFWNCTNLASIVIPASDTYIDDKVFINCKKLQIYGKANSNARDHADEKEIPFITLSGDASAVYTVTFDANGGTGLSFSEREVNANTKLGEVPAVQREGYSFLGWYTASGIRIDEYQFVTRNIVAIAKWFAELQKITFDQTEIKMFENEKYTLSYITTPVEINETFTWTSSNEEVATVSESGEVHAHKAGSAEITITATNGVSASCVVIVEKDETIVTSVEELQSQHPYLSNQNKTWIYKLDGAKFLKLLFSDSCETERKYDVITIYDKNDTVIGEYSGKELAGKEITVDGDTVKIRLKSDNAVQSYGFKVESVTRDKVFYRVGFDANGGTNLSSNSVEVEEHNAIGTLPTVERSGYIFKGWYTSRDGGAKVTEETVIAGDTTFYAQWQKIYTSIEKAKLVLSESSFVYDGTEKRPTVVVTLNGKTLNPETDYDVTYENNVAVGTATVTVKGKGDYTGTISKTFTIGEISLENAKVSLSATKYVYNGKAKTPKVTVELNGKVLGENKEYSVSYKNNKNVGTATVTITGIGSYAGTKVQNFTISAANIKSAKVSLSTTSYTYNGKAKKPGVTVTLNGVKLSKKTDYTVSYSKNKNIGKAKVTIKGKGNYTGTISKTFTIKEKKGATFTASKHKYKVTSSTTVTFVGVTSSSLKKVNIPKTVKYGGKTFKVTAIAKNALKKKTKVTTVTIGANVTTIGTSAFYGCKNVKTIKITSTKLKTVGKQAFKGINAKATIKVPAKKLKAYKKLLKGKGQGSKVKIVKY